MTEPPAWLLKPTAASPVTRRGYPKPSTIVNPASTTRLVKICRRMSGGVRGSDAAVGEELHSYLEHGKRRSASGSTAGSWLKGKCLRRGANRPAMDCASPNDGPSGMSTPLSDG